MPCSRRGWQASVLSRCVVLADPMKFRRKRHAARCALHALRPPTALHAPPSIVAFCSQGRGRCWGGPGHPEPARLAGQVRGRGSGPPCLPVGAVCHAFSLLACRTARSFASSQHPDTRPAHCQPPKPLPRALCRACRYGVDGSTSWAIGWASFPQVWGLRGGRRTAWERGLCIMACVSVVRILRCLRRTCCHALDGSHNPLGHTVHCYNSAPGLAPSDRSSAPTHTQIVRDLQEYTVRKLPGHGEVSAAAVWKLLPVARGIASQPGCS